MSIAEGLGTGEDKLARLDVMVETLKRNQQSINVTLAARQIELSGNSEGVPVN